MSEYKYIIIPIIILIVAQLLKTIFETIKHKKFDMKRLFDGSGGMPSSHSALVTSITTLIGLDYGLSSPLFGICLVLSLITMYDARGIRYETGKQAIVINKLSALSKLKDEKNEVYKLKELLGHKPIEVFFGMVLGILLTMILNAWF